MRTLFLDALTPDSTNDAETVEAQSIQIYGRINPTSCAGPTSIRTLNARRFFILRGALHRPQGNWQVSEVVLDNLADVQADPILQTGRLRVVFRGVRPVIVASGHSASGTSYQRAIARSGLVHVLINAIEADVAARASWRCGRESGVNPKRAVAPLSPVLQRGRADRELRS
jgi:hypothetical protein